MMLGYAPPPPADYESISIGTWSSISDVDNFFAAHTPYNGWAGLKLGNYVTIQDGTYNTQWKIAGFNCEANQTAADGTTYNNGYGICMIPKSQVFKDSWGSSTSSGYNGSSMHTSKLPNMSSKLKTILGDHLILRNVLLSNSANTSATSYTWTTAYATLMSAGQLTGIFAAKNNKYDDGEANYKLPLFNYESIAGAPYDSGEYYIRGIAGSNSVWLAPYNGNNISNMFSQSPTLSESIRPMIYLR